MTLDCPSCGGHLFTQGNHEALVCLNTRCSLYAQPQPDVDAGQVLIHAQPDGDNEDEWDDDEGDDD